jgi:N-acetylglucosaminyl-diphospho-decaprenol L-rhamnosyltransferase
MDDLSIVTVGYQSAAKLPAFLQSAADAAPGAEYIIVDNASTDDTEAVARQNGAHQVVHSDRNIGFGRACNLGAESASGQWLLFANPDITLESVPALDRPAGERYGLGAGLISEHGSDYKSALRAETRVAEDAFAQLWTRFFPRALSSHFPKRRRPARWASAAVLLCRRSEFLSIGGFDRRYFLYFEDRDLGRQYRESMYPLRMEPGLRARHGHGDSSPSVASWVRESWSLVSWIEYRGIWQGQGKADATAKMALSTLQRLQRIGDQLPLGRVRRKNQSVENILGRLRTFDGQLGNDLDFYPHARAALERLD